MGFFSRKNRTFSLTSSSSRRYNSLSYENSSASPLALAAASASASLNSNSANSSQLSAAAAATALRHHDSLTTEALERVRRQDLNNSFTQNMRHQSPGNSVGGSPQPQAVGTIRPTQPNSQRMKQTLRPNRPQSVAGVPVRTPGESRSNKNHALNAASAVGRPTAKANNNSQTHTIRHNSLTSTSAPVETVLPDGTRVLKSTTTTDTGPRRTMSLTTTTIRNLGSFELVSTKTEAIPNQSPARYKRVSVPAPQHHLPAHPHYAPQFATVKEEDGTGGVGSRQPRRPASVIETSSTPRRSASTTGAPATNRPSSVLQAAASTQGALSGRSLRPGRPLRRAASMSSPRPGSSSVFSNSSNQAPVTLTIAPNGRIISRTNSLTNAPTTVRAAESFRTSRGPGPAMASQSNIPPLTHSFPPGPIRRPSASAVSNTGSNRSRRSSSPAKSASSRISFSDTPDYSEHRHEPPSRTLSPPKPALKTRGRANARDEAVESTTPVKVQSVAIPKTESTQQSTVNDVTPVAAAAAERITAHLAEESQEVSAPTVPAVSEPVETCELAAQVQSKEETEPERPASTHSIESSGDHSESEPSSMASNDTNITEHTTTPLQIKKKHFELIPGSIPDHEPEGEVNIPSSEDDDTMPGFKAVPEEGVVATSVPDSPEVPVDESRKVMVDELDELRMKRVQKKGGDSLKTDRVSDIDNTGTIRSDDEDDISSAYATADEEARKAEVAETVEIAAASSASPPRLAPVEPLKRSNSRRKSVAFQDEPELPPQNPLRRHSQSSFTGTEIPASPSLAVSAASSARPSTTDQKQPRIQSGDGKQSAAAAAANAMVPNATQHRAHAYRVLTSDYDDDADDTASVNSKSSYTRSEAKSAQQSDQKPRRMTSLRSNEGSGRGQRSTSKRQSLNGSGTALSPNQPAGNDASSKSYSMRGANGHAGLSSNSATSKASSNGSLPNNQNNATENSKVRSAAVALAATSVPSVTLERQDSASSFEKACKETRSKSGFARFSLRDPPEKQSLESAPAQQPLAQPPAPVQQQPVNMVPSLRPQALSTHQEVSCETVHQKPASNEPFRSRFQDSDSEEDVTPKHSQHHPHLKSAFKSLRAKHSDSGLRNSAGEYTTNPAYTDDNRTDVTPAMYKIVSSDSPNGNYITAKVDHSHSVTSKKKKFKGLRKLFGISQA